MLTNNNRNEAPLPRMLNVAEVAHLLHVHPNTVRLWGRIGVLKTYRIGKRLPPSTCSYRSSVSSSRPPAQSMSDDTVYRLLQGSLPCSYVSSGIPEH